MERAHAHQLVRAIGLPAPRAERLMILEGLPNEWPCANRPGHRGEWSACYHFAKYSLRVALENGCTHIEVHKGRHHRHRFDVAQLLLACQRQLGGKLPRPKGLSPRLNGSIATLGRKARGGWFDTLKGVWAVPTSISGVSR